MLDFSVLSVPTPIYSVYRAVLNIEDTGQSQHTTTVDTSNIQGRASGSGRANMLWWAVVAGGKSGPTCRWLLSICHEYAFHVPPSRDVRWEWVHTGPSYAVCVFSVCVFSLSAFIFSCAITEYCCAKQGNLAPTKAWHNCRFSTSSRM